MAEEEEDCKHTRYVSELKVFYATVTGLNIRQMFLRVRVMCAKCRKPYVFKGPVGLSTNEPRASPDGFELRAPLELPDTKEEPEDLDVEVITVH